MQSTALRYAAVFLVAVLVWMVGKALQGPQVLDECDTAAAKCDDAMQERVKGLSGRRQRSEWERRLWRMWFRGEKKRLQERR